MSEMSFKKPNKNFRRKQESSDSEDDSDVEEKSTDKIKSIVDEAKDLQRMRQRQRGVNAEDLAVEKQTSKTNKEKKDPSKLQTGGYVDLKTLKKEISQTVEDISQIGTSFAAETNRRDEDADMLKYVEEELAKRKGITTQEEAESKKRKNAEDFLYDLPEHIAALTAKKKKNEDMLSNQMLSGIPEVELGIEMKIRNIEATEEAKQRLIQERRQKKDSGISDFVPTNMAANFVQHNRFKIEDHGPKHRHQPEAPKPAPLRVGDADILNKASTSSSQLGPRPPGKTARGNEKATDDFHFEKFKKHMRRF